jgi:hypothetical protein
MASSKQLAQQKRFKNAVRQCKSKPGSKKTKKQFGACIKDKLKKKR